MHNDISTLRNFMKIIFILIIFPASTWGENISISQLDTSKLFISSSIDCYVRLADENGNPLEIINPESDLSMFHIEEDKNIYLPVLDIKKNKDRSEGITFLLLLDNSGSMYDPVAGKTDKKRISMAVSAAETFFSRLDPEKDRGGLALFNREYRLIVKPDRYIDRREAAFSAVEPPSREDSYTELYYTIVRAAEELGKTAGRKAVILLSDGENFPYFENTGKPHPVFGSNYYMPEQASAALAENEVTLYAVNFSNEKDIPLSEIAVYSGGRVFDASDEKELTGIYENIRKNINEEYRVKVKVPVSFSKTPAIEAEYDKHSSGRRFYSPALIFGTGKTSSPAVILLLILSGIMLWTVLFLIRLEKAAKFPELTQLPAGRGKAFIKTLVLTSANTVIGGARSADYTITGIPEIADSHAEIVHDEKKDAYTLVSGRDVRVNNRPVKKRILKPGDVINIEGATMVFDAPEK